jgi:hypothetical protein
LKIRLQDLGQQVFRPGRYLSPFFEIIFFILQPMPRLLPIFLAFMFVLGTLGLKINQHYCCGEMVQWELLTGQQPKDCSGEIPLQKKKCCEDKIQVFKTDHSKPAPQTTALPDPFFDIQPFFQAFFEYAPNTLAGWLPCPEADVSPPGLHGPPYFLQFRNLRI